MEKERNHKRQQRVSLSTVEWQAVMDHLTRNADVIAEFESMVPEWISALVGNQGSSIKHRNGTDIIPDIDRNGNVKSGLPYSLTEFQLGTARRKELLSMTKQIITEDHINQTKFQTESCSLENDVALKFGCPIQVVGISRACCRLVACPRLNLDASRIDTNCYHITKQGELVNSPGKSQSSDNHKFQMYWGTCSSTLIDLTNTLPTSQYWEIHSDVGVIKGWWRIVLDFGVVEEAQVDRERWVCYQPRSWCVCLEDCDIHNGVCAKVFKEKEHVNCFPDAVALTSGTQATLHYGVVLDVGRGRVSFIDLNREIVLGKFDVVFRESLYPVFGVTPRWDRYTVRMKLVSGEDIAMTETKRDLIYKAVS
ncbi:uncharacterized protein LOC124120879 [Haliotis rufescens]|uniref:uncharacterized protein LOC124120879 n=1 Tax=Haliotis rufescens TaxID=6454 RepID=UPI00201F70AF|nr:uncharacterized protein LOC124120879 [Haliotis rufescens]